MARSSPARRAGLVSAFPLLARPLVTLPLARATASRQCALEGSAGDSATFREKRSNLSDMRPSVIGMFAVAFVVAGGSVAAQRRPAPRSELEGTWSGATWTPLQRPAGFENRATFTPDEADEYRRNAPERIRSQLPGAADRLTQADVDEAYVEVEVIRLDRLRTALIVDPPTGRLPNQVPAARARIAKRPRRSFDDPETLGLAERCLVGNFGIGGSTASPPMVPNEGMPA